MNASEGARRKQHEQAQWLAQYFDDAYFQQTKARKGAHELIGYCRRWLFDGHGEEAIRAHIREIVSELPPGRLPSESHCFRDPQPAAVVSAE